MGRQRYRRRTPDRQNQGRMRESLRERLEGGPARIAREEVVEIGTEMGMEPADAVRLFDRLKGVSWCGDYVESDGGRWTAAWVTEVR